ncbi:phosphoglucosamine mutase [Numidum massiliense]|uniref:phosphoglucosamine mutase n=1 Tax=Numidum massiliense TaxID=1522315 RepID=UPI0006D553FB|nr:phosphoglucosamine mutase [Numidum massiliense]
MGKYFGTDGIRGIANEELTAELAYKLGRAGAYVLTKRAERPQIVVGRDTRISGHMLEAALVAGMLSIGADVIQLGVVTTPGVAFLTKHVEANAGVMISASHNPVADNGIKFFGQSGFKLSDETEAEIEALIDADDRLPRPVGDRVGTLTVRPDLLQSYTAHLNQTIIHRFDGLKIVLDCAHGAASYIGPRLFQQLGAEVIVIGGDPNGVNINANCGSTHPEQLQYRVVQEGADLGLAFDGDADRLIAVDENGNVVDGDYIMYILAAYLKEHGRLAQDTLVTTVMSNIGLYKATEKRNIHTVQTRVGDRYVMEKMRMHGYNLGGEQSGHIVFLDYSTTGDGLLTALQLVNVIQAKQRSLGRLTESMQKYPQLMINVHVGEKDGWEQNTTIRTAIEAVEAELGAEGRVLVRPSGTEPLIRVMAEGPNAHDLERYVNSIARVVQTELGVQTKLG